MKYIIKIVLIVVFSFPGEVTFGQQLDITFYPNEILVNKDTLSYPNPLKQVSVGDIKKIIKSKYEVKPINDNNPSLVCFFYKKGVRFMLNQWNSPYKLEIYFRNNMNNLNTKKKWQYFKGNVIIQSFKINDHTTRKELIKFAIENDKKFNASENIIGVYLTFNIDNRSYEFLTDGKEEDSKIIDMNVTLL